MGENVGIFLTCYVPDTCVTELVTHIYKESKRVMKGTTHEKDWVLYHDALLLMTAQETVEWMKNTFGENGESYYSQWILPGNDFQ
jgi:hypothetical protein